MQNARKLEKSPEFVKISDLDTFTSHNPYAYVLRGSGLRSNAKAGKANQGLFKTGMSMAMQGR